MIYFLYLVLNPTAYIIFAQTKHRPLLEIFLLYFVYSTIFNLIFFFFPDLLEKIVKKFFNSRSEGKIKRFKRKLRIVILKMGRKMKIYPLIIYFFSGIIPIPLIKEATLIVCRLLETKFSLFVFINLLQFALFYGIGRLFF